MVEHISIRLDLGKKQLKEYKKKLKELTLNELLAEFFTYLDYQEESDSGNVFNPIYISSCRVMLSQSLDAVLKEMRKCSK